jgi:hypothetical protein
MKSSSKSGINKYFVLASLSLTATTLLTLPLAGSYVNELSYLTAILTLVFAVIGRFKKSATIPKSLAVRLIRAGSVVYALLGAVILWVILAELPLAPQVPLLSSFQYPNYLMGWPIVELVILGAAVNALFRLSRPAWLDYLGGFLAVLSIIIWRAATYYGLVPGA